VRRVKCFAQAAARVGPYRSLDAGPRAIEVARITGTVDKCGELDRRFRLVGRRRDRRERFRRRTLERLDLAVTDLPPIAVYLLSGEYYVIDGNRRVAAAKRQKLEYMDAQVTECIPLGDSAALEGAATRRRFEQETGLRNVRLAYESGYATLLEEIADFTPAGTSAAGSGAGGAGAAAASQRERARNWHSSVFRPACALLSSSPLSRRFPGAEPGDLYVMVARFYRDLMGGYPAGASYPTLLSGFRFARRLPERRPLRSAPFRLLLSLLGARPRRTAEPWRNPG
jgi:hypothetical protein